VHCRVVFRNINVTQCKSPLKIAEYLAMGKAIVASEVEEVRRMLGGTGILVESGNIYSLVNGIALLLQDDSLRHELGKRTREIAEKEYNWSFTAQSLLKAYKKYYSTSFS